MNTVPILRIVTALIALWLAGCQALPPEGLEMEEASMSAIRNYARNSEVAISTLRQAYIQESDAHMALMVEADVDDATKTAEFLTVPKEEEADDFVEVSITYLEPSAVKGLLRAYASAIDRRNATIASFDAQWEAAKQDLTNAVRLRDKLREFLSRSGVQPEHIETIGNVLAEEIEKGGLR